MAKETKKSIRDFIYLDVERVRSLVSQLEGGLIESVTNSSETSKGTTGGLKGSIPGLLSGEGSANFLWKRDASETRTLHDHVYSLLEDSLLKEQRVRVLGELAWGDDARLADFRSGLTSTDFVLVTSRVQLNDYSQLKKLLVAFNDFIKFFAWTEANKCDPRERKKVTEEYLKNKSLSPSLQAGLKLFIETFYDDRLIFRTRERNSKALAFTGILKQEFLHEESGNLILKFGSAPPSRWTFLGQVAAIPMRNPEADPDLENYPNGLHGAFEKMFASVRGLERSMEPLAFPDISVSPIAIYRS